MSFQAVVGTPGSKQCLAPSTFHFDESDRCPKTRSGGHCLLEAVPDSTHSALESEPSPGVSPVLQAEPHALQTWPRGTPSLACDSRVLAAPRKAPMLWRGMWERPRHLEKCSVWGHGTSLSQS